MQFTLSTLFPLLLLATPSLSIPHPQDKVNANAGCIVPFVIFSTITTGFTLTLHQQDQKTAGIDGSALTYKKLSYGLWDAGIFGGQLLNTTLINGVLKLGQDSAEAFYVEPRDRSAYREVRFQTGAANPAKFEVYYACINGKAQRVLRLANVDQNTPQGESWRPEFEGWIG